MEGKRARGSTLARIRWAAAWLLILATLVNDVPRLGSADTTKKSSELLAQFEDQIAIAALSLGCAALVVLLFVRRRADGGSHLEPPVRTDSIYLEAFALYRFQATFGGQVLLTLLPSAGLFLHELVLDSAPLTALAWLHLRGASVVTIRRDSGLIWRRGSLRECGAGLLCFALLAPLTLTLLQDAQPDTSLGAQILLGGMALTAAKAVLYAPLIEEFFFRGLLHRHLRTRHGFVFTASATTLVFVTMHTQHDVGGLALVACMGFLMSVLREWRSSLVAAITMHATVNGVPILILLALFFL